MYSANATLINGNTMPEVNDANGFTILSGDSSGDSSSFSMQYSAGRCSHINDGKPSNYGTGGTRPGGLDGVMLKWYVLFLVKDMLG